MRVFQLAFRPETAKPVCALVFASVASVALVLGRVAWTGNMLYAFLIWNLFLAWLPLVFALLTADEFERPQQRRVRLCGLAATWLLFFPNAPYILTDITHLRTAFVHQFWVDLTLILLCALTGLVLGFVSLYLVQGLVARAFVRIASWGFIGLVAALSGFGVYLGRFLRFNTWDVLLRPIALWHGIGGWVSDTMSHPSAYAFPALFALFLFTAYTMLYGLTHLAPARSVLPSSS
jgi:uncharacterized membrane protein